MQPHLNTDKGNTAWLGEFQISALLTGLEKQPRSMAQLLVLMHPFSTLHSIVSTHVTVGPVGGVVWGSGVRKAKVCGGCAFASARRATKSNSVLRCLHLSVPTCISVEVEVAMVFFVARKPVWGVLWMDRSSDRFKSHSSPARRLGCKRTASVTHRVQHPLDRLERSKTNGLHKNYIFALLMLALLIAQGSHSVAFALPHPRPLAKPALISKVSRSHSSKLAACMSGSNIKTCWCGWWISGVSASFCSPFCWNRSFWLGKTFMDVDWGGV